MLLETFETGPAATNGYLIADHTGGTAAVIDAPLNSAEAIIEQAGQWKTPIALLLTTHPHWDHVLDNDTILIRTGARFGLHRDATALLSLPQTRMFGLDIPMPAKRPDLFLEEGSIIPIGDLNLEVFDCPGHCPGSVTLFERHERILFTGDVLFAGTIGRTDLPGGDLALLLKSIREKLLPLGDDVRVLPGHGAETTLGEERQRNPFLVGRQRLSPY